MDYFGILERSFAVTRRYRVLWLFGFLLALFGAGGGTGNGVRYAFRGGDLDQLGVPPEFGILIILGIVAFVIGLAIVAVIINYVCQTALIGLVGEIEEGKDPTVRHGFDVGWSRSALRLFGVDIAIFVPVALAVTILAVLFIVPFLAFSRSDQVGPAAVVVVCCLVLLIPLFIAAIVALDVLKKFFYRQVVLAGNGVFEAIRNGYSLVRANLGPVAVMWLIMFIVGLLWAAVNFLIGLIALAAVGGPAALIYAIFKSGLAAALAALPFLLIAVVFFAAINALYTVFTRTVWTLTYLKLPRQPA
ncbi:MAG: hypothetical protein ACE5LU_23120 [Anaerolineae bacterium]